MRSSGRRAVTRSALWAPGDASRFGARFVLDTHNNHKVFRY